MAALNAAASAGPKGIGSARWQSASLLITGLVGDPGVSALDALSQSTAPEGRAPLGRNLALEMAAGRKLIGETALLVLWTCAEAGPAGPAIGDRVRIVRALHAVGLEKDAGAFVLEGLASLK
jgi:hypothetical protein